MGGGAFAGGESCLTREGSSLGAGPLRDGLACPSSQANDACKCNGWKNPNPPTAPRMDLQQPVTNLSEPCRSCSHALGNTPWDARVPPGEGEQRCPLFSLQLSLGRSGPCVPPGERLGGGDQPAAGHGGGRGKPLHVGAQGGGHGHQAGVFLLVQGASGAGHVSRRRGPSALPRGWGCSPSVCPLPACLGTVAWLWGVPPAQLET